MSRRLVTTKTVATAGGGSTFVHPECHDITCIQASCYKIKDGDTTPPMKEWQTLYSACGAEVNITGNPCITLDFAYYNYEEICIRARLGTCCCCASMGAYLGRQDGYIHCCCSPYNWTSICTYGAICCTPDFLVAQCNCHSIGFNASFFPIVNCHRAHCFCTFGNYIGGRLDWWCGGYQNCWSSHQPGTFWVDPYNTPIATYCMFWSNFDRIIFCKSTYGFCPNPTNDLLEVFGRKSKGT